MQVTHVGKRLGGWSKRVSKGEPSMAPAVHGGTVQSLMMSSSRLTPHDIACPSWPCATPKCLSIGSTR